MFIVIIFLTSILTIYLFKGNEIEIPNNRFISIDGLRGFLGVSVFIHHAYFWKVFLKTNQWSSSGNYIYNQLGQTSVSLFFMITGFLFLNKIISSKNIKWKMFFIKNICYKFSSFYKIYYI